MRIHNYLTDSEQKLLFFCLGLIFLGFFLNQANFVYAEKNNEAERSQLFSKVEQYKEERFDLNKVSYEELLRIKGIGPKKAQRIIDFRKGHSFTKVEELLEIKGFGESTLQGLSPFFYVMRDGEACFIDSSRFQSKAETESKVLLDIDDVTLRELMAIKGLGKKRAEAIIKYRDMQGIRSYADFLEIKGIGSKILSEIQRSIYIKGEKAIESEVDTIRGVFQNRKIDINRASLEELCMVKGIGKKRAGLIIEYRDKNGGFRDLKQLMDIKGIGKKTYMNLEENLYIGE